MLGIKPGAQVPEARPCWWKWHLKWSLTDRCRPRTQWWEESWFGLKHSRAPIVPSLGICLMTVRSGLGDLGRATVHRNITAED